MASLSDLAAGAVELARRAGAGEAAATADRTREVQVGWRDGRVETVSEATRRSLVVELYVEGRFGIVVTSDLRPDAVAALVREGVATTRRLEPDPDRRLPDPALYRDRAAVDLELDDPAQAAVTPDDRKRFAAALEAAAREAPGAAAAIQAVTATAGDEAQELARVASNGFAGTLRTTSFHAQTRVVVKEPGGRRPEDGAFAQARHRRDLPDAAALGRLAARRALATMDARAPRSGVMTMVVENRAARALVNQLLPAMRGDTLQEKRSFLEGKLGTPIGSRLLTLVDDPLLPRGMSSRPFDDEGLALRRRVVIDAGVLTSFNVSSFHARKLGLPATTGFATNVLLPPGDKGLDGLLADAGEGLLVTGLVGGNGNTTSGDFSFGVRGFLIRAGARAEAVAQANISGNQRELWKRLAAVGNDPWTWDGTRMPSLVFEGVQVAGS